MARARLDTCPMCHKLAWWRVGDRVAMITAESGVVLGVSCDSCGGWDHDSADVPSVGQLIAAALDPDAVD